MITVMKSIEVKLALAMPQLDLRFFLVGSVAEGTRIHSATELDIMVCCNALEKQPLLLADGDPFTLIVPFEDHPMAKWSKGTILMAWSKGAILSYEQYHCHILDTVCEILEDLEDEIKRNTQQRIIFAGESSSNNKKRKMSHESPRKEDNNPYYTHCTGHIFNVTQTKCGACLVFEWKSDEFDRSEILTMDLIPVLPVKGMDLNQMIVSVTKTLSEVKPPNWLKYLTGFINKDRVLPESFYQLFNQDPERPIPIGMKLLHFGQENNFIIRPAQLLGVTSAFSGNETLRKCYARIKCLKSLLNINLNSYFVKKVLLTDEMKQKSQTESDLRLFKACLDHPSSTQIRALHRLRSSGDMDRGLIAHCERTRRMCSVKVNTSKSTI